MVKASITLHLSSEVLSELSKRAKKESRPVAQIADRILKEGLGLADD